MSCAVNENRSIYEAKKSFVEELEPHLEVHVMNVIKRLNKPFTEVVDHLNHFYAKKVDL